MPDGARFESELGSSAEHERVLERLKDLEAEVSELQKEVRQLQAFPLHRLGPFIATGRRVALSAFGFLVGLSALIYALEALHVFLERAGVPHPDWLP